MMKDQALKQKWVAALRSGGFKQGRFALHSISDNTFCCLGVLCVVAGATQKPPRTGINCANYFWKDESLMSDGYLPDDLREEVGLTIDEQRWLGSKNDVDTYDFQGIADLIEQRL